MGCERFEVGVFDASNERMIPRVWCRDTVLKSIAWLRHENLNGRNIYIRPAGEHHLSLVDDLKGATILKMKREGFVPAVLVETSPGNFQAWLNHGKPLERRLSTAVAKNLAAKFHGDLGSADWRHFGRLAGFTNRKEKHRQADGYFPYVRLIEAEGRQYIVATDFVRQVEEELREAAKASMERRGFLRKMPPREGVDIKSIEYFRNHPKYGGAQSRSDLAYAVYALDHRIPESRVRDAITSQDLSFKGTSTRQTDYIDRIMEKASAFVGSISRER